METSLIKSKIKVIIAEMFDIQPADVGDAKPFPEMAKYDSMRALEFLAKVENEFDIVIDPDKLISMYTVDLAAGVIEDALRAK